MSDSVSVAVSGSVPWPHKCEECGAGMIFRMPKGATVPESMFCGRMGCPRGFKEKPFVKGLTAPGGGEG